MIEQLEFDAKVGQLIELGFRRHVAEKRIREEFGDPRTAVVLEKNELALEREEQIEVRKTFIAFAFTVHNLSQYRPSKIMLGFPDLFVVHNREPIALFFETKRQKGGQRSPAQLRFAEDCARTGIACYHGDRFAAAQVIVDVGLGILIDNRLEPVRNYVAQGST